VSVRIWKKRGSCIGLRVASENRMFPDLRRVVNYAYETARRLRCFEARGVMWWSTDHLPADSMERWWISEGRV